jgi:hypothetical protein
MDPMERQRQRELELRREQELKDLETEADHGPRPLEGLSGAPTTWTQDQDELAASEVHADDEAASVARSREQVPAAPPERSRPARGAHEE